MRSNSINNFLIWLTSTLLVLVMAVVALTGLKTFAKGEPTFFLKGDQKVIVLSEKNTVSLRDSVSEQSMAKLSSELLEKSSKLKPEDVIYLVLDTPGGDVDAGNNFIDIAKSIPQRVDTITVRAASMGFHIAQNLGRRLVLPNGTYMSHRIRIGGLSGQVPGEAVTRLKAILETARRMDEVAAKRMGISLEYYRDLTRDEYWVSGERAKLDRAADEVTLAICGKSLSGTESITIDTIFGESRVKRSKCPLISGYL